MTQFFPGDRVSGKFRGKAQFGNIIQRVAHFEHTYDVLVKDGGDWFVTSQNENNLIFIGRNPDVQALIDATAKVDINTGTIKASDVLKVYGFGKGDKVRSKSSRLTGHVVGFRTDHEIQVELLSGVKIWLAHYEIEHVPTEPEKKTYTPLTDHAKDLTRYFKTKYNLTDKTQVGYDLGTLAMLVEKLAKKVEEK